MAHRPSQTSAIAMTDTQRLETLELKCMELENTVQALNDQLVQQYQDFQRFAREIERLDARIDTTQNAADSNDGNHEVPPHY